MSKVELSGQKNSTDVHDKGIKSTFSVYNLKLILYESIHDSNKENTDDSFVMNEMNVKMQAYSKEYIK